LAARRSLLWTARFQSKADHFMEKENVKFYFSFRSPYSWLAYTRIEKELAGLAVELQYMPIYPPSDASLALSLQPAPAKALYIARDVMRFAAAYGLKIKFPKPFDTDCRMPHQGFLCAQENGKGREYGFQVYHSRFSEGRDVGDAALLGDLAHACGIERQAFLDSLESESCVSKMKACFDRAQADRVFGVPTFIYRKEMFWGNDRIDWLARAIRKAHAQEPSL
jgi:2-hydroxychromene-2-carboxylate isomerase